MLNEVASASLLQAKTLCVICTPHTKIIGELLTEALKGTRLEVSSALEMPDQFLSDLYIIVAPQMFKRLPPRNKTFMFQVEQVRASRWVDASYLDRLQNSLGILDYSTDNITALSRQNLSLKQLYHVPIQPFQKAMPEQLERDIDVLFYGAAGSKRRDNFIDALSKRVNLKVENNLFGEEMSGLLARAKIVVNIHHYENALLETTRLAEALSHGASVVSEKAVDQAEHDDLDDLVSFVETGDIQAFVTEVEAKLAVWKGPPQIGLREDTASSKFMFLRALHGCGVLSYDEFLSATMKTELASRQLILGLPEEGTRRKSAQANRMSGFQEFPALRHVIGWKGCAQSYKYIASKARAAQFNRLEICEDDAIFAAEIAERLAVLRSYLDENEAAWDVFSGILTDLHVDSKISQVSQYGGETIIHLDSVIGMVFGIYNRSAIAMLADFEFTGESRAQHTIDRYFEAKKPRCITTLTPIAMQSPVLASSLWPMENAAMSDMIDNSLARLRSKVEEFQSVQINDPSV